MVTLSPTGSGETITETDTMGLYMGSNKDEAYKNAWCEANPGSNLCKCYNVVNNKCRNSEDFNGCTQTKTVWNDLIKNLSDAERVKFSGQRQCYASVCTGSQHLPEGHGDNCAKEITLCKQSVNVNSMYNSNILFTQDCGNDGDSGSPSSIPEGSESFVDDGEFSIVEEVFRIEADKDKKLYDRRYVQILSGCLSSILSAGMFFFGPLHYHKSISMYT